MQLQTNNYSRTKSFIVRNRIFLFSALLVIVGLILVFILLSGNEEVAQETDLPQVTVANIYNLNTGANSLSLVGEVKSQSEARLTAERPGQLTKVNTKAGADVRAGTILAEIENASERASVVQARGVVEGAEANLAKIEAGDRPEQREITAAALVTAEQNLDTAKQGVVDAVKQAYFLSEDAVRNKADVVFTNPQSGNPKLKFSLASIRYGDLQGRIESNRSDVERLLTEWNSSIASLSTEDNLDSKVAEARSNLTTIRSLLDDIGEGVNSTSFQDGDVTTWKANVAAARSSVAGALSTVSGAEQALESAELSLSTAVGQQQISNQGARPEDVQAARASLTQAQGSYQAAVANLEKTYIRTPISGTVNTFSVHQGDFISQQQLVAVVSNNNALMIESFITPADVRFVEVGSPVRIDDRFDGVVTNVAPGLDPVTNKIRIEIGVLDDSAELTHGDTVRFALVTKSDESESTNLDEILVPITALKVETDRIVVFTVTNDNRLQAHPIEEGPLVGSMIIIENGVTADMEVVLDARGLNEGDEVEKVVAE